MATEYKLSYTANEINSKLKKIDDMDSMINTSPYIKDLTISGNAITYTKSNDTTSTVSLTADDIKTVSYDVAQTLTDEQKAQARENVGVAQPDLTVNNPDDPAYVKGRTHWLGDPFETVLLEETTVEIDDSLYAEISALAFVEGQNYIVNWNNTRYECTAWSGKYNNTYIGNGNIYGGEGKGEDVPFCFEPTWVDVTEAGTYTFSVARLDIEIHKIDEKFLPALIGVAGTGGDAEVFNGGNPENASGSYSHAEGHETTASGDYSHAEGRSTEASDYCTHAEGDNTTASGGTSHAEGCNTIASGGTSHAEGMWTVASGSISHVEGYYTIANGQYQHAQGKFNIEDTENKYAHIVGNGKWEGSRSNAHTLDWNGLGWFAGGLKVGGTGQDDANAKEVALKEDIPSFDGLATETYVNEAVANLVNSAPDALNTLDELASALGDDENFATTVTNQIATKASQSDLEALTARVSDIEAPKNYIILNDVNTGTPYKIEIIDGNLVSSLMTAETETTESTT